MPSKILFVVPYPLQESPSQRFRFEQYFDALRTNGFDIEVDSFLNSQNWQLFFKPGHSLAKLLALVRGFIRRVIVLFKAPVYDFIFIHREATPLGPPIIEWLLAKVLRRRIIYDFDDAIWMTDRTNEPALLRWMKWRQKVAGICRWSYKVSCGNDYLCEYARRSNANVVYNPTTIDTRLHDPAKQQSAGREEITIGWTGSHSTLKYLTIVEKVLNEILTQNPRVEFVVIANQKPSFSFSRWRYIPWRAATEIDDLLQVDIGIMPLPDDEWSKGKCGFKALQYMALQIPCVVSPVGVNAEIVQHGVHGFLAEGDDQWLKYISSLIRDASLRKQLGKNGRKRVEEHYSVFSNERNFLSLFA